MTAPCKSTASKRGAACAAILTVGLFTAAAQSEPDPWRMDGFEQPESVLAAPQLGAIFVSNIGGAPGDANGRGFISRLFPDGSVETLKFVDGLNAPKGMALGKGVLYVSDLNRLHAIDPSSGEIVRTYRSDSALFLNDVTIDGQGWVYVSDLLDNTIYRLEGDALTVWFASDALANPNGILADDQRLIVGSWGAGLKSDFTTEEPGGLLAVDLETKALSPVVGAERLGNIDGIVRIGPALYASDWVTGELFRVTDQGAEVWRTTKPGLADIGAAGRTLYLPFMHDGVVEAVPIE